MGGCVQCGKEVGKEDHDLCQICLTKEDIKASWDHKVSAFEKAWVEQISEAHRDNKISNYQKKILLESDTKSGWNRFQNEKLLKDFMESHNIEIQKKKQKKAKEKKQKSLEQKRREKIKMWVKSKITFFKIQTTKLESEGKRADLTGFMKRLGSIGKGDEFSAEEEENLLDWYLLHQSLFDEKHPY